MRGFRGRAAARGGRRRAPARPAPPRARRPRRPCTTSRRSRVDALGATLTEVLDFGLKRGQAVSSRVKRGQGDDRIGALRGGFRPQPVPGRPRALAVADRGGRKKRADDRAARRSELTNKVGGAVGAPYENSNQSILASFRSLAKSAERSPRHRFNGASGPRSCLGFPASGARYGRGGPQMWYVLMTRPTATRSRRSQASPCGTQVPFSATQPIICSAAL